MTELHARSASNASVSADVSEAACVRSGQLRSVLHVIPSLAAGDGGATSAVLSMANELAKAGLQVTIATTRPRTKEYVHGVGERASLEQSFSVRVFDRQVEVYKVASGLCWWLIANINRFDVVHVHALFSFASTAAAILARRRGVPYVVGPLGVLREHGMKHRRPAVKWASMRLLEARLLASADAVHFTSNAEMEDARKLGFQHRPVMIPLGAEMALGERSGFLQKHPSAYGAIRLLFVGRLDPIKNLESLIRALGIVSRSGHSIALIVAGSGNDSYRRDLVRISISEGVSDRILWLGHVEGGEKADAFAAADLFVLPSFSESFGLAGAEAAAAGLPLILSKGVALADDVVAAGAGMAVDPTASSIAAAIGAFASDPDMRTRAGASAKGLAEERYSSPRMGRDLLALYQRILDERYRTRA